MLDRLRKETKFKDSQYGGIKEICVDHFLVKTWDEVFRGLQDEQAYFTLTSIDFEKAFNKMDHHQFSLYRRGGRLSVFSPPVSSWLGRLT